MDVRLRDLRYFAMVAEEQSFTIAAERLHVSQPSMSKQIRQLEATLRTDLFNRDRRQVSLTPAGAALLPTVRQILEYWDDAIDELVETGYVATSVLRVGAVTSIGRGIYPAVTRLLAERAPTCRLDLRMHVWTDATAGLLDRSADVAFVWLPLPSEHLLEHRVLVTEPRSVALSSGHRYAGRVEVDFTELLDEPFVALPPLAGPARDFWLAVDERGGRQPRIALNANTPDEKLEAIAAGTGIALLAAGNSTIYDRPGIVCRPVGGISPAQFAVAWRRNDDRPLIRTFVDACLEAVTE